MAKTILKVQYLILIALSVGACTKGIGTTEDPGKETTDTASFAKNVLIMEFVSFDCVYCPDVSTVLEEAAEKKHPGRIDVISVHGKLEQDDPMEFSGYRPFQNYFYGVTGYPGVIIDQRDDLVSVGTFDTSGSGFLGRLNTPSPVGIALSSSVEQENTIRVEVQVANKGDASGDYRLAVAVLENDIPYRQADLVDGSLHWIEDYRHQHVLRAFLSESYFGDPVENLPQNGIYAKTFTYRVPSGYKTQNLSLVAYVIEAKGFSGRVSLNSRSAAVGEAAGFHETLK